MSFNVTPHDNDPCDLVTLDYDHLSFTVRQPIVVSLFIICIFSVLFYSYVIFTILNHRLHQSHPFFLWFVSIGLGDLINLANYTLWFLFNSFKVYPVSKIIAIWFGHVYQFAYNVCLFHFPTMAFIRMLTIVFPIQTLGWFDIKRTLMQIMLVWLAGLANTIFLQSYKSNWMYFSPSKLSFENVCWDPDGLFKHYWDVVPPVFILFSNLLYAICYITLRLHNKLVLPAVSGSNGPSVSGTQKAEKNLLKVSLSMTLLMTCDHISWLINVNLLSEWWSNLLLSIIEIAMFTINSAFIILFSPNLRNKTFISHCFSTQ